MRSKLQTLKMNLPNTFNYQARAPRGLAFRVHGERINLATVSYKSNKY